MADHTTYDSVAASGPSDKPMTRECEEAIAFVEFDLKEHMDRIIAEVAAFATKAGKFSYDLPRIQEVAEAIEEIIGEQYAAPIVLACKCAEEQGYEAKPYEHPLAKEQRKYRTDRAIRHAEALRAAQGALPARAPNPASMSLMAVRDSSGGVQFVEHNHD